LRERFDVVDIAEHPESVSVHAVPVQVEEPGERLAAASQGGPPSFSLLGGPLHGL